MIRHVLAGRGVVATDPIWPLHWANEAPGVSVDRSLRAGPVERLLPRLSLRASCRPACPSSNGLRSSVQRSLFDAGVDLRLEPVPMRELAGRLSRGDFDTYLLEQNAFGLSWTYWMWHSEASGPAVSSGYRGADVALDGVRRANTRRRYGQRSRTCGIDCARTRPPSSCAGRRPPAP